jgi:hypothetical protein
MVNALKKNPNNAIPQTTTLQCLTSMDFTSCHIWEEDPLVLVRTYYHSLLVFLSNDLMTVRFDEMVTVIKHPLETRKKRMVFNVLLRC